MNITFLCSILIQMVFGEKKNFHVATIVCLFISLTYFHFRFVSGTYAITEKSCSLASQNHTSEFLHSIGSENDWKNVYRLQRYASYNYFCSIPFFMLPFTFILYLLHTALSLSEGAAGVTCCHRMNVNGTAESIGRMNAVLILIALNRFDHSSCSCPFIISARTHYGFYERVGMDGFS